MLSQRTQNIIAFVIALASTALSVYYFNKPRSFSPSMEKMKRARTEGTRVPKALGHKNPIPKPVAAPDVKSPEEKLRLVCEPGLRELAETENSVLMDELTNLRPFFTNGCLKQMKQDKKFSSLKPFIEDCQLKLEEKDPDYIERRCLSSIGPLKALIIRLLADDNIPPGEKDLSVLGQELKGGVLDLKNASLEDLDKNIATAEELLNRDPDYYDAYKGKLLSQLMRELKFNKEADEESYQALYDELWRFRVTNERDEVLSELRLAQNEEDKSPAPSELEGLDPDLVQLPFLRLKALGDYEALGRMAEEYVDAWPESMLGRQYLAEAVWATGDKAEAVRVFKEGTGRDISDEAAYQMISKRAADSALEQITRIKSE